MFSLRNKFALVTGAASGIGRAVSQRFIRAGCQVLLVDRRADGLASANALNAGFFQADVSEEAEVEAMFKAARHRFGRVDILVNNAGIQPLGIGFRELTPALLERTFAVNVNAVALGIKHAARYLAPHGRIINMGSFVGVLGTPGAAVYAPSKAAVIHLTRLAALELAPSQITVNAVSPGTIRTPAVTRIPDNPEIPFMERRTPLRRLGQPEEVAALCHFLASDEAAYITGQNILIDGGLSAGWTDYELTAPANVQHGEWVDD